jgi:hypothetical protein|tara:strand:- start:91 stop:774 length:684 start_codon:yes stop_codon:yes gene_type:complete
MTSRKLLVLGSRIGKVVMPKEKVSDLISITDKSVSLNEDFGYALASQIKNEKVLTKDDLGSIWTWLEEEVSLYVKNILKDIDVRFSDKSKVSKNLNIETSIESMWTVSQFENEYNPVHYHTEMKSPDDLSPNCQVSSVLYLKIPKNISRNLTNKKGSPDGAIEFISQGFGTELQSLSTGSRRIRPMAGHLYIFPSWLPHTVYPFVGKGERRSLAFNSSFKVINKSTS